MVRAGRALLAAAALVVTLETVAQPAHAAPQCPPQVQYCAGDGVPGPDPIPTPGPGPGPGEEPRGCGEVWHTVDQPSDPADVPMWRGSAPPQPGDEGVWQSTLCATRLGLVFMYRWVPTVTPEIVANDLWVEVSGTLPNPAVESDPPPGTNAIVSVPVFVEVANWTGTLTPSRCVAGFCVTVTVTPSLVYEPAEPGSPTIACSASGTRYDPNGAAIEEQAAAPGACAYAYEHRTGTADRPAAWPASVSVTWNITWSSSAGNGGSLPAVTRTTEVPRGVDEVQTVVVG